MWCPKNPDSLLPGSSLNRALVGEDELRPLFSSQVLIFVRKLKPIEVYTF